MGLEAYTVPKSLIPLKGVLTAPTTLISNQNINPEFNTNVLGDHMHSIVISILRTILHKIIDSFKRYL